MKTTIMKQITLLFLIITCLSFTTNKDNAIKQAYLKKGYTVALSQSYFKEMMNSISTRDEAYFLQLIKDFKTVTLLKDTKVSVIESSFFKGTVVARIYGKSTKVWTVYKALKYE